MEIHRSEHTKYSTAVGKDGWLYIWEIDDVEKKVFGEITLNDYEYSNTMRNVELRNMWCNQKRIHYIHLIAPDKATVYPQYLPDGLTIPANNLLSQHRDGFLSNQYSINYIDTIPILRNAAAESQIYFKTDAHWNYHGAGLVLDAIAANISAAGIPIKMLKGDALKSRTVRRILELGALMPDLTSEEFEVIEPAERRCMETYASNTARGKAQIFSNQDPNLPRAIVFRDSYTSFFLSQLVESFSTTIVLNSRVFWYDLVEQFKPDVVIMQVAERFLYPIVVDINNRGFENFFGIGMSELLDHRPQ